MWRGWGLGGEVIDSGGRGWGKQGGYEVREGSGSGENGTMHEPWCTCPVSEGQGL